MPKPQKHIILSIILIAYLAVMGFFTYPYFRDSGHLPYFFAGLAVCFLLILGMVRLLKNRNKE